MKLRHPSQAGMFYAGTTQALRAQIEECFTHRLGPGKLPKVAERNLRAIVGLVCPHAGYMYSGPVAAHAYYHLAADGKPDVVVLFGPNHTGRGSALALMRDGVWRTPLGDLEIDTVTANLILKESGVIDVDDSAHAFEHSIEVQLPFLQYLYGSAFRFVPICFLMQDLQTSREVGTAVAKALADKNALVIASTDMTHYEPQKTAEQKDKAAIEAALKLDAERLYSTVEARHVTMCGCGPTVAAITAAKALNAREARLLCYKTSGDITGDYSSVVGYASMMFTK
ncbi:MAG: AmmeMemoRadiSam system protein B [Candidatus Bathyarchaeia archaeon]